MIKKLILPIILLFIGSIIALYFIFGSPKKSNEPSIHINGQTFSIEIADTKDERAIGLSARPTLAPDSGMLFIFEQEGMYAFWMKNTLIPLDMIFIKDNRIVTIHENVHPQQGVGDLDLTTYAPTEPVTHVLEINGGLSQKYGFKTGDTVTYANIGN